MIILTGSSLSERHRELNTKVKEAAAQIVDFEKIKNTPENSDFDKLFKIDLASKTLNSDYIVEILKSGDSLHISRALKCTWLYDLTNIINVDYLHNNVFPFMSTKMKKKLLSAISVHVRDENRAAEFYKYCMEIKLKSIAFKFIIFTSDDFKLELLKDESVSFQLASDLEGESRKQFIGLSFVLAEAYIAIFYEYNRVQVLKDLCYLYTVSDVKYLDLLEKNVVVNEYNNTLLGLRISKSIMKKHKDRVLKNTTLYMKILQKSVLVRYSTAEDAKTYAVAVLPDDENTFWNENYCNKYKYILDIISVGKFEFIKKIFTAKYPGKEFETSLNFYNMEVYKFMTADERERWALEHIGKENNMFGAGKDYIWYKFVTFDKALAEIKKRVMITPDRFKRADMVNTLTESAKTQRDVEKLLNYFYERHVNEQSFVKEKFLDRLMQNFNVYEFDEDCWGALDKIFHSLEVYSTTNFYSCKIEYKLIALIYSIVNKKEVHEGIKLYIRSNMQFYQLKTNTDKLPKEHEEMVFQYLFNFYMDEVRKLEAVPYDDDVKYNLRKYIHFVLDLLDRYKRTKQDCPEILNNFMKLDWPEFKAHNLLREPSEHHRITQAELLRDLKKDAKLLVEKKPHVRANIEKSYKFLLSTLLKKLKIYFSNDIAKEYLNLFDVLLTNDQLCDKDAHAAAHGIFQLADETFKTEFMTKYAPTQAKINHREVNEKTLRIQQAICAQACYSRPPVPLKHVLMYLKGDYVRYCLPMFQSYLANLPLPQCIEFIEAILNAPVSIQKHGIRLAFECFNAENLNKLVLHVWNRTKNVSLRMIIFKAIFNKISEAKEGQDVLFETLKTITSTLHQEDDEEVFGLLVSRKLPSHFMPDYIEIGWKVVSRLPLNATNISRKQAVIRFMDDNINVIRQDSIREIIDELIESEFRKEEGTTKPPNKETLDLIESKWSLTAAYLVNVQNKDDLDRKMKLTTLILKECLGPLETGIRGNKYVLRKLCFKFINYLENKSYNQDYRRYENINIFMQYVLQTLQDKLSIEEMYILVWDLRLGIIIRKVIADVKPLLEGKEQIDQPDKLELKDIANHLAKEFGNLIKEFVDKDLYFTSFSTNIQSKIVDKITNLFCVESKDLMVALSLGLIQFDMKEIYLLVVNLISSGYTPKYKEEYKSIIDKLKNVDCKEIRCNLYEIFVNSDFEVKEIEHF